MASVLWWLVAALLAVLQTLLAVEAVLVARTIEFLAVQQLALIRSVVVAALLVVVETNVAGRLVAMGLVLIVRLLCGGGCGVRSSLVVRLLVF